MSKSERVDPRVVRTRKLILDAFLSVMREKGFDEVSIQDITDRATLNRATFYAHFPDKYALLDTSMRELFGQMLQHRLSMPGTTPHAHLRRLLLAVTDHLEELRARHCKDSYQRFAVLAEAQIKSQLQDAVCTWLDDHPQTRSQPRHRLELAATLVSWSMYGAALAWQDAPNAQSAESFADEVVPLLVATITAVSD